MVVPTYNPNTWGLGGEDHSFKNSLGYIIIDYIMIAQLVLKINLYKAHG